jgi:putative glycosyltransferase
MELSIATTIYKSEKTIEEFLNRSMEALKKLKIENYEIIIVNDGSEDQAENIIKKNFSNNKIKIINLSKNFGHHKATITALKQCSGSHVFFIDSDLEINPEIIIDLWKFRDTDMVFTYTENKYNSFINKLLSKIFYKCLNFLSDIKIDERYLNAFLFKKKCVENIVNIKERFFATFSIYTSIGFDKKKVLIDKKLHKHSTTYSFYKKIDLGLNFLINSSEKPLKILFYISIIQFLIVIGYLIFNSFGLVNQNAALTFGLLDLLIVCLLSFLIFLISLILLYLSALFLETKNRPISIIKEIIDLEKN